jgi:hypothetical protein
MAMAMADFVVRFLFCSLLFIAVAAAASHVAHHGPWYHVCYFLLAL